MNRALPFAVALALLGCGEKASVKECDELVSVGDRISKCESIPATSRKSIQSGIESMRNALKMLDDAGGKVPQDQLEVLKRTCQQQLDSIRKVYEKTAPECLK